MGTGARARPASVRTINNHRTRCRMHGALDDWEPGQGRYQATHPARCKPPSISAQAMPLKRARPSIPREAISSRSPRRVGSVLMGDLPLDQGAALNSHGAGAIATRVTAPDIDATASRRVQPPGNSVVREHGFHVPEQAVRQRFSPSLAIRPIRPPPVHRIPTRDCRRGTGCLENRNFREVPDHTG